LHPSQELYTDPGGAATTTLFLSATRNGRHPIGTLASTAGTFINEGTTTEYMTRHVGTYIDDKYAKIESTGTREYYRVRPTRTLATTEELEPTGLVSSTVSYEVHGRMTTEHSVHHYRTYIDGHYAHLVSTQSKVYSDAPPVSATPVFQPQGGRGGGNVADASPYRFPDEQISPSRPASKDGLETRTVGKRPFFSRPLRLEQLLEKEAAAEGSPSPNAIRARSVDVNPSPVEPADAAVPTFTVAEDGQLNIPSPPPVPEDFEAENEIEPSSSAEYRQEQERTSLDSVTYIGFVDFTTTIDDTVVIFRPKKTFRTATRNVLIPKIEPTRAATRPTVPSSAAAPDLPGHRFDLRPSTEEPERHRTSLPDRGTPSIAPSPVSQSESPRGQTSGINPLKSLLAASASRRNLFSKPTLAGGNARPRLTLNPNLPVSSASSQSSAAPTTRPGLFIRPSGLPGLRQRPSSVGKAIDDQPGDLSGSIDPSSDVELVYKTLYTTYTYFTTFFRSSTSRVKSREEVISNVVTLTNILSPSDLASLRSSCQVDKTCIFASSGTPAPSPSAAPLSSGFVGRPNTKAPVIEERPRSGGVPGQVGDDEEVRLEDDVNAILRTFYTTYTYFTTLFVDGTSSISTRTEVYSNVKSSGVPVSILSPESVSILPSSSSPPPAITSTSAVVSGSPSPRRLEYSSIARDVDLQKDLTTPEEEEEETTTADSFVVVGITAQAEVTEAPEIDPTATRDEVEDDEEEGELLEVAPASVEAVLPAATPTQSMKTFFTTFTYFTTLYRNGTSYVTSNLVKFCPPFKRHHYYHREFLSGDCHQHGRGGQGFGFGRAAERHLLHHLHVLDDVH